MRRFVGMALLLAIVQVVAGCLPIITVKTRTRILPNGVATRETRIEKTRRQADNDQEKLWNERPISEDLGEGLGQGFVVGERTDDAIVLYRIEAPTEQVRRQAEIVAEAATMVRMAIDDLETREKVRHCVIEINRLENDGDRVVRDAIAGLFDDDMKCIDVIKWKDVYELLEKAIDDCEHVANIIESIVLKNN